MMQVFLIPSTFGLLSVALCRLVTARDGMIDGEQYRLILARMPMLYDDWALTKRDVCADAIPGTVTSICTPGNTLCCTPNNTNNAYPQCETILGSGYCCTSATGCYIDTPSDCAASNSVQCTMLAAGTTEACCPPFTTCPNDFNQSSTVRCNLDGAVSSSSSSSSASTSSTQSTSPASSYSSSSASSITPISSPASDTLSPVTRTSSSAMSTRTGLPATTSKSSSLSPGADAGIGIGVALVVLAIAALSFWAYRHIKKKKKGAAAARAMEEAALGTQTHMFPGIRNHGYFDPMYGDTLNQQGMNDKPELPTRDRYERSAELGANYGRAELM